MSPTSDPRSDPRSDQAPGRASDRASGETVADVGEFGLIARIRRRIERAAASAAGARGVVVGPGDDGAVVRPPAGRDLVVTTDSLVEDVHFRFATQSPRTIGRRALVANLSDLAAMGAEPSAFVAAFCAPPTLPARTAEGIVAGLLVEATRHACPLVGGNVSAASETSISITAFGSVRRGRALRRDAARAGDRIFVTGALGGAALAVARAEQHGVENRRVGAPRVAAGLVLGRTRGVGACIDLSDGLASDLPHLLAPGGLGADVDAAAVPRPRGFAAACRALGVDPDALALAGGEDYELLFTVRAAARPTASSLAARLGLPVAEIGRVTREPGVRGLPRRPGWRHF